ncbi:MULTISPECIES: helix-turn-helix transcriptional regulator [Klebsiella/Raoultella group]|jgi:excisionase family DNA binding protein|nr:helix-turn-helix domain-containing protein [Raoultella ornithinolytica]SSI39737.1 Predicted transcriptional regulator [Klebsiella pneumoniae]SSI43000.1 Predicted transcriptional regulator [Klebsiella pneumoniae]VUD34311.1 Predicted transcriptional regulator [Raoultella sp. NCTC 9187]HBT3887678.1 AlpA family phage regulatory protein [Klebsiella pneumoniae]
MLLTVKQLCIRLGISRSTVERLRRSPESSFPEAIYIGPNSVRFSETEIEAWVQARRQRVAA